MLRSFDNGKNSRYHFTTAMKKIRLHLVDTQDEVHEETEQDADRNECDYAYSSDREGIRHLYDSAMRAGSSQGSFTDLYHPQTDFDPQGSYTGRPENPEERPVQDADDL